jgi:hypothetical protein
MKKVVAIVAGVIITSTSFAQFSVGVQGIGNLSDAKYTVSGGLGLTKKAKVAPGGGFVAQYQLNEKFAIRSGINFLQHGLKLTAFEPSSGGDAPSILVDANSTLNYLQVPVNFLYTVPVASMQLFAGAGPYFNYGISGKTKLKMTLTSPYINETVEEKDDLFKEETPDETSLKRFDFGVGAVAGVKFNNGMFVNAGYQLGLSNIDKTEGNTYKNRGLQLTIGYFFK